MARVNLIVASPQRKLILSLNNKVTNTGQNHTCLRLLETPGQTHMSYIGVGTGGTAVSATQSALFSEIARKPCPIALVSGGQITYSASWAGGELDGFTVREVGLFNSPTTGVMFARAVYPDVILGPLDGLDITWDFTINVI